MAEQRVDSIEVQVTENPEDSSEKQVIIQDSKGGRAWSGEGRTAGEAATKAVRRLLGDRRVREYT